MSKAALALEVLNRLELEIAAYIKSNDIGNVESNSIDLLQDDVVNSLVSALSSKDLVDLSVGRVTNSINAAISKAYKMYGGSKTIINGKVSYSLPNELMAKKLIDAIVSDTYITDKPVLEALRSLFPSTSNTNDSARKGKDSHIYSSILSDSRIDINDAISKKLGRLNYGDKYQQSVLVNAITKVQTTKSKELVNVLASTSLVKRLSSQRPNGDVVLELETISDKDIPYKVLEKVIEDIDLAELKGSKSIMDMIEDIIFATLEGKKYTAKTNTRAKKKISSNVSTKKRIVKPLYNIATVNIRGRASQRLKQGGKFASLQGLIAQINNELHDRIRANMGKGSAKTILNYRSGRFARSAKLLKLDITRENAITAIYTYMKYPYQTFEPGFRQGQIRTRDPRAMIQKSMREVINQKFQRELSYKFNRL